MRRLGALLAVTLSTALVAASAASAHQTSFDGAYWKVDSAERNDDGSIKVHFELMVACRNADMGVGAVSISRKHPDGGYRQVSGLYYAAPAGERVRQSVDLPSGAYRAVWEEVGCAATASTGPDDSGPHGDDRKGFQVGLFELSCPAGPSRPIGGFPLIPVRGCNVADTTPPAPPGPDPCAPAAARGVGGFPLIPCGAGRNQEWLDRRGRVGQRIVCSVNGCTGTVSLRTAAPRPCRGRGFPLVPCRGYATRRRVVTLGKARFSIPAGRSKVVKVRLKRRQLRYVKSVRRLRVRMVVSGRSGEERIRTEDTFTLRAR